MDNAPGQRDEDLAELLGQYLAAQHSANFALGDQLVEQHPELAEYASSMDVLGRMGPDADFAAELLALYSPQELGQEPEKQTEFEASTPIRFGGYELLEELGRGGMGVVFKARQVDLDRIVAVKMILVNRLASRDDIRRFYLEAKAAGRLSHPHIVSIHEVGDVHGQHFFSMDCIDGPSLADVLQQGPAQAIEHGSQASSSQRRSSGIDSSMLSAATDDEDDPHSQNRISQEKTAPNLSFDLVVKVIRDVAKAADYLHGEGIIHRDLKPSNILLDESGHAYVTDFGLAKMSSQDSEETHLGTIVGTPSYMSPEQAAGRQREVSPVSDIYSLGAILYECLAGRVPHRGANAMQTLVQVMESEPEVPRQYNDAIPRDLEAICLKCLEKEPTQRYQSAAELAEELDKYLRGEPVQARAPGFFQHVKRWYRRKPALAARWSAMVLGGGILHLSALNGATPWNHQIDVLQLLAIWAVVSWIFQTMIRAEQYAPSTTYLWLSADAVFITRLLVIADPPVGPLVIVYPLLIVAAGLFCKESLVFFMTSVSLVSYAAFLWYRPGEVTHWHYPLIFAAVMVVIGCVTAHQVHRIRILSRHMR